jgi:hypothetical protein
MFNRINKFVVEATAVYPRYHNKDYPGLLTLAHYGLFGKFPQNIEQRRMVHDWIIGDKGLIYIKKTESDEWRMPQGDELDYVGRQIMNGYDESKNDEKLIELYKELFKEHKMPAPSLRGK